MYFVIVTLLILSPLAAGTKYQGKYTDYPGFNETVFIYNGDYFEELALENDGSLSVEKLRKHCPSVTKLVSNSTAEQWQILDNKKTIKPQKQWIIYNNYICKYGTKTSTMSESSSMVTTPKFEIPSELPSNPADFFRIIQALKNEITEEVRKEITEEVRKEITEEVRKEITEEVRKEITEEVRKEINELKKDRNQDLVERKAKELKETVIELGEAANHLDDVLNGRDLRDHKKAKTTPVIKTFGALLSGLANKRNEIAHSFKDTLNQEDCKKKLKSIIFQALHAQRHLVCTNNAHLAEPFLPENMANALFSCWSDFRLNGTALAISIQKILLRQFNVP